ncbi:MAG: hypothetical protein ACREBA_07385, partial [Nitrosotalea sp.]
GISFINDRAAESAQFIAKRSLYGKAMREITVQLPKDVTLDTVDMQTNVLTLTVDSPSLDELQTYETNLVNDDTSTQVLQGITFQTIELAQSTSIYQMTLIATIHE